MGSRGAFVVDEVPSERWNLALDLLRDAGSMFVLPGKVPVGLQRYAGWPGADGRIHVSVFTSTEPRAATQEMAERDVAAGLATVREAAAADHNLTTLFEKYGVVYEYVYDYGHGAVRIGDANVNGAVRLL